MVVRGPPVIGGHVYCSGVGHGGVSHTGPTCLSVPDSIEIL